VSQVRTWKKSAPSNLLRKRQIQTLEEHIELLGPEESRSGGVSLAILASLVVHTVLIIYLALNYHPVSTASVAPIVRYVELIRQQPKNFVEAPGPKTDTAPLTAPYSNANRKASMPKPTGENPTNRPGEGGLYAPSMASGAGDAQRGQQPSARQAAAQPPSPGSQVPSTANAQAASRAAGELSSSTFSYHPPSGRIDWKSAIQEVGKVASLGGSRDGVDMGNSGGEKGFAESGPLSFETQWYDWGDYAQSMVNRIRVNWYEQMPILIRMGVKGVVTIRFTIHRDGRITDVTMLSTSSVPPYDFAAHKAIELSSPLNPLPKDFPNETERVTCQFYYNLEPPARR
jgi:TonB family protein